MRNGSDLTPPSGNCVDLSPIEAFSGADAGYRDVTGLDYVGPPEYPIAAYGVIYAQTRTDASDVLWADILSSGWLDGDTTYTRPNFSGVFTGSFELEQGVLAEVRVSVLMANKPLGEWIEGGDTAPGLETDIPAYGFQSPLN